MGSIWFSAAVRAAGAAPKLGCARCAAEHPLDENITCSRPLYATPRNRNKLLMLRWLLLFLQMLLLLSMPLLQLLGLLLVPLLDLLLRSCVGLLLLQPLMLLLLLLLKFLPILFLLCQHFFLLLLVFFIAVGVSGVGRSWTIEGRKLFRMNCGARRPAGAMRLTATTIGGRVVSRPGFFCGHCGVKVSWSIRSGNWRLALVGRGPKLRVVAGCLEMLGLSGNGRNMT